MKKRIIIAAGAVLLAASAAVAISTGKTGTAEQMLFEANVEALMRSEGIGNHMCLKEINYSPDQMDIDCKTCELTHSAITVFAYCD